MATATSQTDAVEVRISNRWSIIVAVLVPVPIAAAAAAVGWELLSPGSSILLPTMAVAGISLVGLIGGWVLLAGEDTKRRTRRSYLWSMLLCGVLATWWTYAFALNASMLWDSAATPGARAALTADPINQTRCVTVKTGEVGLLQAPYDQCALNTLYPGPMVFYYAASAAGRDDPGRGLVYDDGPAAHIPDACVRYLGGDWYAFTMAPDGLTGYFQCIGGA